MAAGQAGAPRRIRGTAVLLLASLAFTAACGARWSDDEREFVMNRQGGSGQSTDGGGSEGTDGSTADTLPGATDGGTTGAATTGGGGTTTGGSTTGGTGGPSGPRPCAAASTAPGVTKDTITVANINTISGPLPGLGETSRAAAQSYVAYLNANGGVCGRKVVMKSADDGYENARYRALITQLGPQVLGIAGGLASGDGGGVDLVTNQKIPVVATATADTFQAAPTVFDINPPFANVKAQIGKYKYLVANGVKTAALVYIDNAIVKTQVDQQRAQMEAVGIKIVLEQALPISTISYDAAARAVANSKADYLFYPAAGSLNVTMARAMYDTGYKLKHLELISGYGSDFIEVAGAAVAENAVTWIRSVPIEEKASNAETARFVEWMGRAAPGVKPDYFAADAWAATKAFFDNVQALPGPITRDALIAQLKSVGTYDADGFFGPIQLGKKLSNGCYVLMQVVAGKWKRITPASGFIC